MTFAARIRQADTAASKRRSKAAARVTKSWLPKLITSGFTQDGRANQDLKALDIFDWMRASKCPKMSTLGIFPWLQDEVIKQTFDIKLIISQFLAELRRPAPSPAILHSSGRPVLASIAVRLIATPLRLA